MSKGFNLSPRGSDYAGGAPWSTYWTRWDWEGDVLRDIELGLGLGGTVVRIIGAPAAVLSGALPQDLYFARMRQVLDLCRERGLRFSAVGGSVKPWTRETLPVAQLQEHYVAQARLLAEYGDTVTGFDLNNELLFAYRIYGGAWIRAVVAQWARAVKAAAPSLPLTVSNYPTELRAGHVAYPDLDDALDYYDFHLSQPLSARAVQSWRLHKPVVIGEVQLRRDDPHRGRTYRSIVEGARDGGAGSMLAWDIASNDFGLYTRAGTDLDPQLAAGFADISR